jgi:hypothetical protein
MGEAIAGRVLPLGLGALQVFVGLGAVAGGLGLVLEPSGTNLGMPVEILNRSPFPDFLIPGMILFLINGLGSLAGGAATFLRYRYAGEIAVILGAFLILWIVAQVWWIGLAHWLQPLYFVFGGVELALGLMLRRALHASKVSEAA